MSTSIFKTNIWSNFPSKSVHFSFGHIPHILEGNYPQWNQFAISWEGLDVTKWLLCAQRCTSQRVHGSREPNGSNVLTKCRKKLYTSSTKLNLVLTVSLESIQRLSLFPYFVILQTYSRMDSILITVHPIPKKAYFTLS